MKKIKKQAISVVLVFCMLLTLFPWGGVLAVPDEYSVTGDEHSVAEDKLSVLSQFDNYAWDADEMYSILT